MTGRLDSSTLERALASLDFRSAKLLGRAGQFAALAGDADRWGLRAEAEEAVDRGRRCRVRAVMLGALAAGIRYRLSDARA